MTRTVRAVYQDGVFKPLEPVGLPDGSDVRLNLDVAEPPIASNDRYARSFGVMSKEEAAEMRRVIDEAFDQVEDDE